jgi:lysophospholipase L1-like esterase
MAVLTACGGGGSSAPGGTVESPTGTTPPAPAPAPRPPAPAPTPAPAPSPPPAPTPPFSPLLRLSVNPGTWAVMGSSTAAGVGATPGHGWAALIADNYAGRGVSAVNLGLGGSVTYNGLSLSETIPPGRPPQNSSHNIDAALSAGARLVLVGYPSNDTAYGYTSDETVRNHVLIAIKAKNQNVPTIVLSSQPQRGVPSAWAAATFADIDRRLAQEFGPCFVEVRSVLSTPQNTLDPQYDSGDGQHLNDLGHALLYNRVKAVIDSGNCVRVR